ncbi:MAG: hypothetical protein HBSAPP04_13740 [Ignavibacteriaceae bacterium]|nr:MAG: hypothetical protein EDM75_00085 [Chlorobiota bacterium]GJQ32535.1 MAG: hypothetical protein HBSAPP04_13740 [Ignavibacteriaceae bacterium]
MGQQQLLLIVLGVIIVALAVVGGIRLWNYYSFKSSLDLLRVKTDYLLNDAYRHFRTPEERGGGGDLSFAKWSPPKKVLVDKFFIQSYNKNKTKGSKTQATFYITTTLKDSKNKNSPIQGSVNAKNVRTRTYYDSGKKKWYKF